MCRSEALAVERGGYVCFGLLSVANRYSVTLADWLWGPCLVVYVDFLWVLTNLVPDWAFNFSIFFFSSEGDILNRYRPRWDGKNLLFDPPSANEKLE